MPRRRSTGVSAGREERELGWGTLWVPFRSHRKLRRMGMVKSLSISQVLPYNLSQTIKIIKKINPLPLNQAGEYLTGRQDHHWQSWVGPSSWLSRAPWESWVPGHGWGCGDSRAEAKVATCGRWGEQ